MTFVTFDDPCCVFQFPYILERRVGGGSGGRPAADRQRQAGLHHLTEPAGVLDVIAREGLRQVSTEYRRRGSHCRVRRKVTQRGEIII